MHEIKSLGVFQNAKFTAVMCLLFFIVTDILSTFIWMAKGWSGNLFPFGRLSLQTLLSPIATFIGTALVCLLSEYSWLAAPARRPSW